LAAAVVTASLLLPHYAGADPAPSNVKARLKQLQAAIADTQADQAKLADAVAKVEDTINQLEHDLADAKVRQLAARTRKTEAQAALLDATRRARAMQAVVAARARSTYISGSPAELGALVSSQQVERLLDQVAILDQMAREGSDALDQLRVAERDAAQARADYAQAEQDAEDAQAVINVKLGEANQALALRTKAKLQLEAKLAKLKGQKAVMEYNQLAAEQRTSGVRRSGRFCVLPTATEPERYIIERESHFDPTADNPTSTAFGLGQLLVGGRIKYLGDQYDTTDCELQFQAFRGYVRDRYGTAAAAKAFWVAHHWY
jgi:septal ring factor EnvC (AmiA/AmiB activator)